MNKLASKPAVSKLVAANAAAVHSEKRKAPKKTPSKPLKATKDAVKAEPKKPKGPKVMADAALNAVADKLGDKFIGDADIVSAKVTKNGCRLVLTNGKTVVLTLSIE